MRRKAGAILIQQGSTEASVWYLRTGRVVLSVIQADTGEEISSAIRGADTVFGAETAFGRPVDYQVRALTDVTACCLSKAVFREWLGPRDSPACALLDLALRESQARAGDRSALDGRVEQRVARHLLAVVDRGAEAELEATPQKLLARTLEMRPETLSRALAALRRAGALAPGRRIVVLDSDALRGAARENHAW